MALSGTGKSTQAKWLQELCPDDFSIICGDRPILEFRHFEQRGDSVSLVQGPDIIVHPSPWNGKENWFGANASHLAGVILLERGADNSFHKLSKKEAAIPMYSFFIQTCTYADEIKKVAELETRLLSYIPVFKLVSNTVPESTRLLINELFKNN